MPVKKPLDIDKQLEIKTKTVQRNVKEVQYYHKEVEENEAKLAKMKEENQDPYDIKKFQEVLDESHMMIPESQSRMKKSVEDLASFMEKNMSELKAEEWISTAKALVKEHGGSTSDDMVLTKVDVEEGEAF